VNPRLTNNILIAKKNNINIVYGHEISIEQALIQLKLYVNKKISRTFIKRKLNKITK